MYNTSIKIVKPVYGRIMFAWVYQQCGNGGANSAIFWPPHDGVPNIKTISRWIFQANDLLAPDEPLSDDDEPLCRKWGHCQEISGVLLIGTLREWEIECNFSSDLSCCPAQSGDRYERYIIWRWYSISHPESAEMVKAEWFDSKSLVSESCPISRTMAMHC